VAYNNIGWLSLYRKGEKMIEAFERDILPEIEEVFDIQKAVELINESGDKLRGKIDFIASFKDDPSTKFIIDNKTSSGPYSVDSVKKSTQLSIYTEAENTSQAAYVVLEKKIRFKEPKVRIQIIKDSISEEQKQSVFSTIESKLNNIACAEFHKKDSPKECMFYGRACEFFNLCWHGRMDGLKKRD
jgi:RecB family exonuclease